MVTKLQLRARMRSLVYPGLTCAVIAVLMGWALLVLTGGFGALEWFVELFGMNLKENLAGSLIVFSLSIGLFGFAVGASLQIFFQKRHAKPPTRANSAPRSDNLDQ